jgi:hypothetical protein
VDEAVNIDFSVMRAQWLEIRKPKSAIAPGTQTGAPLILIQAQQLEPPRIYSL